MIDELVARCESSPSNGTVIRDERDIRIAALERDLAEARSQLSAAHDVRDVFARDLNRMVEDCAKDEAARDATMASLTDELRRAKAKAE